MTRIHGFDAPMGYSAPPLLEANPDARPRASEKPAEKDPTRAGYMRPYFVEPQAAPPAPPPPPSPEIVTKLDALQAKRLAEAQAAFVELVVRLADGEDCPAEEADRICTAAGKSPIDLRDELALCHQASDLARKTKNEMQLEKDLKAAQTKLHDSIEKRTQAEKAWKDSVVAVNHAKLTNDRARADCDKCRKAKSELSKLHRFSEARRRLTAKRPK